MKKTQQFLLAGTMVLASGVMMLAQGPAGGAPGAKGGPGGPGGGGKGGGRGPVLSVASSAWADGTEVPAANAGARGGGNKSPDFQFHWFNGTTEATVPDTVKSYAVIFHDIENVGPMKSTSDTLHWSAFNIPGDAKGLPAGLGPGKLADGTVNGPGIAARGGMPGSYFGPGAGPGPWHHYIFEFYALDTKLDLPDSPVPSREDLMKAMEGHVVGKAAYTGRFHGLPQ